MRTEGNGIWGRVGVMLAVIGAVVAGVLAAKPYLRPTSSKAAIKALRPAPTSVFSNEVASTSNPSLALEAAPAVNTNDPSSLIRAGVELMEANEPGAAIAMFTRAVELDPEDPDIHFNLGMCFTRQGSAEKGEQEYLKALELDPEYIEAHNNLGTLYMARKDYTSASKHLSAALKIMPDYGKALNNMGKCLSAQNHAQEGLVYFSQAVRADPNSMEARYNLATALVLLGREDEAIKELEELLRHEPNFEPARKAMEAVQQRRAKQ